MTKLSHPATFAATETAPAHALEEDENFKRHGVPTTKDEYIRVREASLKVITLRDNRMADWVEKNHPRHQGPTAINNVYTGP